MIFLSLLKTCSADLLTYQLEIYNRWGEKVFESDQLANGWDATFKRENVPQDVFTYIVYYSYLADEEKQLTGTITVIR